MAIQRPGLWPLHDNLGINMVLPEVSLYLQSGYPIGLPVPSADHNGKLYRGGQWARYLDLNGLRNEDWLDVGVMAAFALASTALTYNTGGNVLSTGATVDTRAVYLIEGLRVETDTAFLNPLGGTQQGDPLKYPGATVPGRIWVYASSSGDVRYDSVGPAVADTPNANEITLVGVQVDATGVVTDGALAPAAALPTYQLGVTIPLVLASAEISGALVVNGNTTLGNSSGDTLTVLATSTFQAPVTVNHTFTVSDANPAIFTGNVTLGTNSADAIGVNGLTNFNANAFFNANVTLGVDATDLLIFNGTVTAAGATPAFKITHTGSGRALYALATDGYAGYFESDSSSPVKAALFIAPQDADPSSAVRGDFFHHGDRDAMRFRGLTQNKSLHASPKGRVFAAAMDSNSLGLVGSSGNICSISITPEETGSVLLTATLVYDPDGDTDTINVTIRDNTAGSNIVTRTVRAKDIDGAGERGEAVCVRVVYTLPSAVNRTFVMIVQTSSAGDVYNPTLSCEGVF